MVTSTDSEHTHHEKAIVSLVNGSLITIESTFNYSHHASSTLYGDKVLDMRAEVSILSRNIKIKGDSKS